MTITLLFFWNDSICQSDIAKVREILKKNAPDEYTILERYENLPKVVSWQTTDGGTVTQKVSGDAFRYIDFNLNDNFLSSIAINIHEINHGLSSSGVYLFSKKYNQKIRADLPHYFYVKPEKEFLIDAPIDYYPSLLLDEVIPEGLRTFRYKTYIKGNSSTQQSGVSGLLDEFNSYMHTLKTIWQIRPAYMNLSKSPQDGYLEWLQDESSYWESYYEFRYFILEYFLFAKNNKPEIYQQLRKEISFSDVFNSISEEFFRYITLYKKEVNEEMLKFPEEYQLKSEIVPGKSIMMGEKNSNSMKGIVITTDSYEKLCPVLQSKRYNAVVKELGLKVFPELCFSSK